jgi:DNA-binding XRE family transcriptional regulator
VELFRGFDRIRFMDDSRRVEILQGALARLGPYVDPMEELLKVDWPQRWLEWPPGRALIYLRQRFNWSQQALAHRAGLSQAQISRLERGDDAKVSTWRRVYAAMGLTLLVAPTASITVGQLGDLAESCAPPKRRFRSRARPRRR